MWLSLCHSNQVGTSNVKPSLSCPKRVSYKSVRQNSPTRVSHKSVLQESPTRLSRRFGGLFHRIRVCIRVRGAAFCSWNACTPSLRQVISGMGHVSTVLVVTAAVVPLTPPLPALAVAPSICVKALAGEGRSRAIR